MATIASGELSHLFEDFLKEATDRAGAPIYRERISQMISSGEKSLVVDFGDLLKYNDDLANRVIQNPDSALASFRTGAYETMRSENVFYADKIKRDLVVRIRGISDQVPLRKVDTAYLDRMLAVSGMVVRTSELRPLVVDAAWVCPNGHVTVQAQDDLQLEKPPRCELCGEVRNFELDRKQSRFIDFQIFRIQELPEELPPGQLPQFFDVNLEGDVVNTARPGDRVVLTGILRAVPDYSPGQVRMRLFRSQIDCNFVEVRGKEPTQIQLTKQDEAMISSIAKGPDAYEKLIGSMAPAILGHDPEKEAILLLLVGGSSNILPDGTKLRGDINILLVGDPGTGKSELLKFTAQVAPRGLFASGRGTTAAGLSAAVIREKNVLMLEAGVVVLADQGIACIDEFDKMRAEDRSALHEQMEQQSYHPSSEILFANGERKGIGEFVESVLERRRADVQEGFDCEFVDVAEFVPVYTADFSMHRIHSEGISRVSRHKAPSHFVRVRFSNGRSILVTPEHPIYVVSNGRIETMNADSVRAGAFVPAPRELGSVHEVGPFLSVDASGGWKLIQQPSRLSPNLGRVLGYLISEGNFSRGSSAEVDFTNLDGSVLEDMQGAFEKEFGFRPTQRRIANKRAGLRFVSTTLLRWFEENFPGMAVKPRMKRVPPQVVASDRDTVREFLSAAFRGDGSVETSAVCYRTASPGLARDYQDLLLRLGIASRIDTDTSNDSFKVYVTGDSLPRFLSEVVQDWDPRVQRIRAFVERGQAKERNHDVLPMDVAHVLIGLRRGLGLSYDGRYWQHLRRNYGISRNAVESELEEVEIRYLQLSASIADPGISIAELRRRSGWSQQTLARLSGVTRGSIDYLEEGGYGDLRRRRISNTIKEAAIRHLDSMKEAIAYIRRIENFRFLRVTEVETVPNEGEVRTDWVYDLTVEKTHNFVSSGIVLHNSVTIAKGGIYASLNARTAILAAMNPVLGKYNPFQNLTDNIGDVPIPLLTRFDLIFVVKDQPSLGEDEKLATHILTVHSRKTYTKPPPVEFGLLKKYISYAKKGTPTLTKEATDRLRDYYLELRKSGGEEGQLPPTPRTLESLIRLATARAKLLLKDEVGEEDALAAVALMNRMVEDVLTDATTKKTDFGIQLGKPAGERKNLGRAMEVFKSLEGPDKKAVERKAFKEELMKAKFTDDDAEKMVKTMFREGLIYESKPGFFRRVNA